MTRLCREFKGWTDQYVLDLPYLRVAMHVRNLKLIGQMEKDQIEEDKAKDELRRKQQARLAGKV